MNTYTYNNETNINVSALAQALPKYGIFDAKITLDDTTLTINTVSTQANVTLSVSEAQNNTLFSNKTNRIQEVQAKSSMLAGEGVDDWAGNKVELNKQAAEGYYTDYEYLLSNPSKISAQQPYLVYTLDGRGETTTNVSDIKTLADNAADRLIYIYTADNGDKGELTLIQEIINAADQTALDAIVDNRT